MVKRVFQVAAAAVLAMLLVFVTTGASGEHPAEKVETTLGDQKARVNLPPTNRPKGVAIFFHGQGGNVNDKMEGPWLDALRRDGWVVASSMFHREAWGNPASTDDTNRLWDWATRQGGAPVKLYIGTSMGGSTSLDAMVYGKHHPECYYGVKVAVDMSTMGNVPGANGYIRKAYGGQPFPHDRNPINLANKLAKTGATFRFVASPYDPYVPYELNTEAMANRLKALGADVSVRPVQGPHDDPSHYSAYDLVKFANECAGTQSNDPSDQG
ncbi:alpha/beta hydrolase family protein [Nocardioides acrostichi]|uniref:Alpha/beta hydrolase n=1 Tax=Nocardioides acrostichi TaxID=2784339 RepID=A0A930Y737_9ACTN|nr:hypothetical protein [Nocardioides acrostichi]MBF4161632.1 hypothetical protein [Nocardioides acrostichi]